MGSRHREGENRPVKRRAGFKPIALLESDFLVLCQGIARRDVLSAGISALVRPVNLHGSVRKVAAFHDEVGVRIDHAGIAVAAGVAARHIRLVAGGSGFLASDALVSAFDNDMTSIGIANLCFHANPVIHANDQFEFLTWDLRRKIFTRMLGFARRIEFRYHCFIVDKKYATSPEQIASKLYGQMAVFTATQREMLALPTTIP